MTTSDGTVQIALSHDEALVLFEWLARNENALAPSFQDPAEHRVIWKIEAVLERTLEEPFRPDYDQLVAQACARVLQREDQAERGALRPSILESWKEAGHAPAQLQALVLRCVNVQRSKEFYEHLGLNWTAEQHGSGPVHYSSLIGSTLVEIYPSSPSWPATRIRLALRIPNVTRGLERLTAVGFLTTPPRRVAHDNGASGLIVDDPDGNVVELEETPS